MRLLLALILLAFLSVSSSASLLPRSGGAAPQACSFTGSTTNLSCLSSTDTVDYLASTGSPNGALSFQFVINGTLAADCTLSATNCLGIWQSASPSGNVWTNPTYFVTKAVLCAAQTSPGNGAFINFDVPMLSQDVWLQAYQPSAGYYQVPAPCSAGADNTHFVKNDATGYYTLGAMCDAASSGDSLEAKAMPSGIPFWLMGCDITVPNVTLTLDPGTAYINANTCIGAADALCIQADNVMIIGAGAILNDTASSSNSTAIDIYADQGTNATIKGAAGNPFIIDCHYAGELHGIESGRRVGLVTISHVQIQNCATNTFPHSIYLSWGPSGAINNDQTYNHAVDHLTVINNVADNTAIKFDDTGSATTPGTMTNSAVYCTDASHCGDNQPYDSQCGGNQIASNDLFEMYGQGAGNDQWVFAKLKWGTLGISGCMSSPAPIDNYIFENDIFIFDGTAYYTNGWLGHLIIGCGSALDGNDCNAGAASSFSTTSSTPLSIGTGIQNLTVATGLSIANGRQLIINETGTFSNNMVMNVISYDSETGALSGEVIGTTGGGTFSAWTVGTPAHAPICVKNSLIIEDDTNFSPSGALWAGPGVYLDGSCTTSADADTNTYYEGQTGTNTAGRTNACKVLSALGAADGTDYGWNNCNTAPNVEGAWPYVPDYTKTLPTKAAQSAEAIALGCSVSDGTKSAPISGCP